MRADLAAAHQRESSTCYWLDRAEIDPLKRLAFFDAIDWTLGMQTAIFRPSYVPRNAQMRNAPRCFSNRMFENPSSFSCVDAVSGMMGTNVLLMWATR